MHKFMGAIGFHDCYTKKQFDEIVKQVLSYPDEEKNVKDAKNRTIFQSKKYFASRMGVSVIGEIDERGFKNVLYAFPFIEGSFITEEMMIQLQKFAEKDAYAGISEDYNLGVSLIFYISNVLNIIDKIREIPNHEYHHVMLSALSTEGSILFGIEKDEQQLYEEMQDGIMRKDLFTKAQSGDAEAIESITLQDIDLSAIIARRAENEDIYSIVDTTFMPYGVESDQYTVVGYIRSFFNYRNVVTNELIYVMDIECNNILISVAINARNLLGEPLVGRRFKGNIWLQGLVLEEDHV